jgi:hypothetical protein
LQQADEKKFETIPGFLSDIEKAPFRSVLSPESFFKIIENLYTLYVVNTYFELTYKAGGPSLKVTYTTSKGSASDMLHVSAGKSKDIVVRVEPKVLKDSVGLAKSLKDTELQIIANRCVMMKASTKLGASLIYVCSLV